MAIVAADIVIRLSQGNTNAQTTSTPNASLGGTMSTTAWAGGTLHDLFDQVSGTENGASESEYRCVYFLNNHGTLTAEAIKAYISAETAGGASLAIGLDPAGVGNGTSTGVATVVANEDTAPTGVTFSSPTTDAGGLAPANVAPAQAFAIWIRRTTANTSAVNNDGGTLAWSLDTAA